MKFGPFRQNVEVLKEEMLVAEEIGDQQILCVPQGKNTSHRVPMVGYMPLIEPSDRPINITCTLKISGEKR